MNINRIINESINKVITEGYSGKYYEGVVDRYMKNISYWLKMAKKNCQINPYIFTIRVDLGNHNVKLDGRRVRGGVDVFIKIAFTPKNVGGRSGIVGKTLVARPPQIELDVSKMATVEKIKSVLLHEITHVVDKLIQLVVKYRKNDHQAISTFFLNPAIGEVLYRLWDTSEFNAWQTYYDLDSFVELIMKDLQKAYEINDENQWQALGGYLMMNNLANNKLNFNNRNFRNAARIKKYFINTSFNKLKKYIKKYKL